MKILVLNGSPRPHGNTAAMVAAFAKGAQENGHQVDMVNVCQKKIAGCLAKEPGHPGLITMKRVTLWGMMWKLWDLAPCSGPGGRMSGLRILSQES